MSAWQEKHSIVPASYVFLERGDEILLLRRLSTGYRDGYYSLPAGHFNGWESAAATAIRESEEEVGAIIDPQDLRFAHVINRVAEEGDHERVDFFFRTDKWSGEITNREPHKASEIYWCDRHKLPPKITPLVAFVLRQIERGNFYSEFGFGEEFET